MVKIKCINKEFGSFNSTFGPDIFLGLYIYESEKRNIEIIMERNEN